MMLPPAVGTHTEQAWRDALAAIEADLDAGRLDAITPDRFPTDAGEVPVELAPEVARLLTRVNEAIAAVRSEMDEIDDELRANSTRGSRRWTPAVPSPSQLDFSA